MVEPRFGPSDESDLKISVNFVELCFEICKGLEKTSEVAVFENLRRYIHFIFSFYIYIYIIY